MIREKFRNMMIGIKLGTGFGSLILFLIILAGTGYFSIRGIMSDAANMIDGANLKEFAKGKEIDHLNWISNLSGFMQDKNIRKLDIEINDTRCGLGKFIHGEERKHAEDLVPSLAPVFREMEEPHKRLHESAVEIERLMNKVDVSSFLTSLYRAEIAHMDWINKVREDIEAKKRSISVTTDPAKCGFGRWLISNELKELCKEFPGLGSLANQIIKPHKLLHESGLRINSKLQEGNYNSALKIVGTESAKHMTEVRKILGKARSYARKLHDDQEKAKKVFLEVSRPAMEKVQNQLRLISIEVDKNMTSQEELQGHAQNSSVIILIISMFAILLGISFAIIIAKGITGPVTRSVDFAKKMSGGDLTQTLDLNQKDEIGILAGALNEMSKNLRRMFKDISTGVTTLASSSTELSAISQQMSTGSEQTSTKANTVAVAAEEMTTNMTSVSAATEQASTNLSMVATAAEEMTATIGEIAQNSERAHGITNEAVSQTKSALDRVDKLGKAAHEIGNVTETITEISEQTNLLALNATIEAARAGEAGKGFAVVASEIKELAKQTAGATLEIKEKISGIQKSTTGTVTEIEYISKVINDVNEIVSTIAAAVEEQSTTSREIAENVSQASQGIQEVTENVAQSSSVSGEIARDISEVNQTSSEMSNSSSQVNLSAEELSSLSEQLKEMVDRFKV